MPKRQEKILKRPVREMTADDTAAVSSLFTMACDEMVHVVPPELRESYCRRYTKAALTQMLHDPHAIMLVSEEGAVITGFLIGSSMNGVGTIHWLRTHPHYRDQGFGYSLHFAAMEEFARRRCYKVLVYLFADAQEIIQFYKHQGFTAGDVILEDIFGFALRPMVKTLRPPTPEESVRRIVLIGSAGQGIKVMSHALAAILASLGKHVALSVIYPTTVRAGVVRADLTFSEEPVATPFIDEADLLLQLAPAKKSELVKARKIIRDREVAKLLSDEYRAEEEEIDEVSFKKIALEEFGSPLFINMVAMGRLLHHLGIDIEKVDFAKTLPAKFLDQNIRAIRYGYSAKDE
ncbi:MAG: GNAT family N-acetyltransferase [Candidatus Aureabacteria bacterium]|nr:GNAT family N-acetyltransferase [Candidatus Auribacterota bacterium]